MPIYKKGIVPRRKEFQDTLALKGEVYNFIKETLEETSEKAFSDQGFPQADKPMGVYADGKAFGMGTATNHYNIKVGGQTQSFLEKQISFGGKRMLVEVHIAVQANSQTLEIKYRTTESSAFRGYGSAVGPMMINEQLHYDLKNMDKFKKEFKEKMKEFADKEVGYMTSTKLGTEDPIEKSTASMVENKLNLNDVFFASDDDFIKKIEESHITLADDGTNAEECDNLILSDEGMNEESAVDVDTTLDRSIINTDVTVTDVNDARCGDIGRVLTPTHSKEYNERGMPVFSYVLEFPDGTKETFIRSQLKTLDDAMMDETFQAHLKEITSLGGAGSAGGFQYDAPLGGPKRRSFKDTEMGKRQKMKEEKGHWGPRIAESNDGFWTVVSQETLNRYKKDHIMGAPGAEDVEINSESEEEFNSGGIKKFPQGKAYKDGDFERHNQLKEEAEKAQQNSVTEYMKIDPSVRKKWRVEEAIPQSSMNERWTRLATFTQNETIKKAESVTPDKKTMNESFVVKPNNTVEKAMPRNQNISEGDVVNGKKVIKVTKNNTRFRVEHLVNEEDYLNTKKAYIHDYMTGNLVNNPNYLRA